MVADGRSEKHTRTAVVATLAAVLAAGIVSWTAPAALAAPDPSVFPIVVDVSTAVDLNYTGPGSGGQKTMSLPMGATAAGTAKILHGRVTNSSTSSQCLFFSGTGGSYLQATGAGAGQVTIIESVALPLQSGVLPVTGSIGAAASTARGLTSSTSDWDCEYGTMIAAGQTYDFTITAGVPLSGVGITAASIQVKLDFAQPFDQVWNGADFDNGYNQNTAANPWMINVSQLGASPAELSGIGPIPGNAYRYYGKIINDQSFPVKVTYVGYSDSGTGAPYMAGLILDWAVSASVVLQPGASTAAFSMVFGMPWWIGNESRLATTTVRWNWQAEQLAVDHTVTFDANDGSGATTSQTSSAAAALLGNTFVREGYVFTGWNTARDGTGLGYPNLAQYDFAADVILYAQWVPLSSSDNSFAPLPDTGSDVSWQLPTAFLLLAAGGSLLIAMRGPRRQR